MLFDEALYHRGIDRVENLLSGFPPPSPSYLRHTESYRNLWLASPSTRFEVKQYYFSKTRFVFCSPVHLENFVDQLSTYEWSLLRLITLEVHGDSEYNPSLKDWMAACARLPPNLVSIQFGLSNFNLTAAAIHGHWFIVKSCPVWTSDTEVRSAVIAVNTLGKLAHRVAARAGIGLAVTRAQLDGVAERDFIPGQVLNGLEPWNKDWLSWWEEKTKIDLEGDETFNKAA